MTSIPTMNVNGYGIKLEFGGVTNYYLWLNNILVSNGPYLINNPVYIGFVAPVNNFILSPTNNVADSNARYFTINYMDQLALLVNNQVLYSQNQGPGFNNFTISIQILSGVDRQTTIDTPIIHMPPYPYNYNGTFGSFIDYYDRYIQFNGTYYPQTEEGVGTRNIMMKAGTTIPFYKIQGYAIELAPNATDIEIREGFIRTSTLATNTYTADVITEIGYLHLTITIDPGQTETMITYHVYSDKPYQLPNVTGSFMTIDNGNINNGIITTSRSQTVTYEDNDYNIIVLQAPQVFISPINVLETTTSNTYPYDLYELLQIDKNISRNDIKLFNGLTALPINDARSYEFGNISPLTVKVLDYALGTINVLTESIKTNSIFAIIGKYFDLVDYISPMDEIDAVNAEDQSNVTTTSAEVIRQNGTKVMMLEEGYVKLNVTIILKGSRIVIPINMNVIPAATIQWYLDSTSSKIISPYTVGSSIMMITPDDSEIRLYGDVIASTQYTSDLCTVSIVSGNYVVSNVKQSIMFLCDVAYLINPVTSIQPNTIYARKVPGEAGSIALALDLPIGPTYNIIEGINTMVGSYTGGASSIPVTISGNDLRLKIPNYNDGTFNVELKAIEAEIVKVGLVHTRTLTNYTYLYPTTPIVTGITYSGNTITVTAQLSYSDVIAYDGAKYVVLQFYVLPSISTKQTIYYTSTNKYQDVLPSIGYVYMTSFIPSSFASSGEINFEYGELSGVIHLVKFEGKSVVTKLYKRKRITGVAIQKTIDGPKLVMPYETAQFKITHSTIDGTQPPQGDLSTDYFTIEINDEYLGLYDMPELFITTDEGLASGGISNQNEQLTLYSFQMLPSIKHQDVYIYGEDTWIQDVPCRLQLTGGPTYSPNDSNQPITVSGNTLLVYVNVADPIYANYGISLTDIADIPSFTIYHVDKHLAQIHSVVGTDAIFEDFGSENTLTILSCGTSPDNMSTYRTQTSFSTTYAVVDVMKNGFGIKGLVAGEMRLYFLLNSSLGTNRFVALDIVVHPLPYTNIINLEYFDDTPIPSFDASDPEIVFDTTNHGTGSTSTSLVLSVGKNTVRYRYYDLPATTSNYFECNVIIKLYKKPGSFNQNHTMRTSDKLTIDIIKDLFGETVGYEINQNPVVTGTSSTLVASRTNFNKQLELVTSSSSVTTEIYTVQITITVPNTSMTLASQEATIIITVIVWNPAYVTRIDLLARPNTGTDIPVNMNGDLKQVVYSGTVLYDSSTSTLRTSQHKTLNWNKYSAGFLTLYSTSRSIDSYFFFTTQEVYMVVAFVVEQYLPGPSSLQSKELFIDGTITGPQPYDLLDSFLPSLRDQMVELNIGSNLSSYNIVTSTTPVNETLTYGGTITTFKFTATGVSLPTPIGSDLTFVTPIKKVLHIRSTEISYDSIVTSNYENVTNVSDGIDLYFSTSNTTPYIIPVTLTKGGITTSSININVLVYDPHNAIEENVTIYKLDWSRVFTQPIMHYIIDGVNYGLAPSSKITITSPYMLNLNINEEEPRIAFTVQTTDGILHIIDLVYVKPAQTDMKIYLYDGVPVTLAPSDLTNIDINVVASLIIDTTGSPPVGTSIDMYSSSGDIVGQAKELVNGSITLTPAAIGVWETLQLILQKSTNELLVFRPYIETLGSPIIQTNDITVNINGSINIRLNDYILNDADFYVFKNWKVAINGSTPINLPSYLNVNGKLLTGSNFPTTGIYVFTADIADKRLPLITPHSFVLNVVVVETNHSDTREITLIGTQIQNMLLPSPMVSTVPSIINGLSFSNIVLSGNDFLSIQAASTSLQPTSLIIIMRNGTKWIINISQIPSLKDLSVVAFEYTGNVFNIAGQTVINYIIDNVTYLAGTTVVLGGQSISIQSNGDYSITASNDLTITVTYNQSNTLTLEVSSDQHKIQIIERLPAPIIDLGGHPRILKIQGTPLEEGKKIDYPDATYTYRGDKLYVTNISTSFTDTLIQWELETNTKVIVDSVILQLATTNNTQMIYQVVSGTNVEFVLPYAPHRLMYDTMVLDGVDDTFDIFGRVTRTKLGNVTVNGTTLQINALPNVDDTTKPITITQIVGNKEVFNYFTVSVTKQTNASFNITSPNSIIPAPTGTTYVTIGLLESPYTVVNGLGILDSKVQNLGGSLMILSFVPTSTFSFYATLSNGLTQLYRIPYVEQEVFVSDITKIPLIAFTTKTSGFTFVESGVTVSSGYVMNPNNHVILTMITPKYVKLLLTSM